MEVHAQFSTRFKVHFMFYLTKKKICQLELDGFGLEIVLATMKLYTTYMNGVDRADQLKSSSSVVKRAAKWLKYLF